MVMKGSDTLNKKLLGICIVIASVIVSGTLLYINLPIGSYDRYKVAGARVFDTQEGRFIEPAVKVEPTPVIEKIHVSMDEINELLDMRTRKEYLTPLKRRKLDAYYCTQLNIWAKQYSDDYNAGKINNYYKYDIESIELGSRPRGTYKQDKPFWYNELPINSKAIDEYIIDN
jgi:hypothetical protein